MTRNKRSGRLTKEYWKKIKNQSPKRIKIYIQWLLQTQTDKSIALPRVIIEPIFWSKKFNILSELSKKKKNNLLNIALRIDKWEICELWRQCNKNDFNRTFKKYNDSY